MKLRPEINDPLYYIHLVMIGLILNGGVFLFMKYVSSTNIYGIFAASVFFLFIGDVIAHTILRLD